MAVPGGFNVWLNNNKKPLGWTGTDTNQAWNTYGNRYNAIGANRQAEYDKQYSAANPTPAPVATPTPAAPVQAAKPAVTKPAVTTPTVNPLQAQFDSLQKQYDTLRGNYSNLQATPTPAVATNGNASLASLTPTADAMLPSNYEASPMYKFQQQEGQNAIKALLAKNGNTNSSAELRANTMFQNQLGSQEAERAMANAQTNANRLWDMQQFEANRGDNARQFSSTMDYNRNLNDTNRTWDQQQFEATRQDALKEQEASRQERTGTNNWSKIMDILNYGYQTSPMANGYAAANTLAGMTNSEGSAMADYLASMYNRSSGGYTPAPIVPYQSSTPITSGYNNNSLANNLFDVGSSLLSGFLK